MGYIMPVGKEVLKPLERKEVVTLKHGWRGSHVTSGYLQQEELLCSNTCVIACAKTAAVTS